MSIKRELADLLYINREKYLSGSDIAESLGVTRAAVWKSIQSLEADGYVIEAVKNRGYLLGEENDMVFDACIRNYIGDMAEDFSFDVRDTVTSTNLVLKENAASLPQWQTVISGAQSAGRGRVGRSFYSPAGTGVYLSVLLRPELPADEATLITTAAAVAVARAVEECSDKKAEIKWVNDVFVDGKKICGILTEAAFDIESGGIDYAILGVGINVYEPEGGFPEDIKDVAGAVFDKRRGDMRSRLAAAFLRSFRAIYEELTCDGFVAEYKARSFLIGRNVTVIKPHSQTPAVAIDIDAKCRLIVRYTDGSTEALSSGEVSVRPVNAKTSDKENNNENKDQNS